MSPSPTLSLVADIGGTNTRVALAEGGRLYPGSIRRYRNAGHGDFHSVLQSYLSDSAISGLASACVAVAGPVRGGEGILTNLDWRMSEPSISGAIGGRPAALLNDLQAQGHALGRIDTESLRALVSAPSGGAGQPQLVIGIGTGFNAAPVHETPGGRFVAASECGHTGLPVRDDRELDLSRHVSRSHGFAAVEDVLSGRGLERLDAWLAARDGGPPGRDAAAIMAAIAEGEPRALEAGRLFTRILGAVAGDLALIHLPFGGVWLVGGVARAFAPHLSALGFAEAFRDKGRFRDFMEAFPVAVIEDDFAALIGCAAYLDARTGTAAPPAG